MNNLQTALAALGIKPAPTNDTYIAHYVPYNVYTIDRNGQSHLQVRYRRQTVFDVMLKNTKKCNTAKKNKQYAGSL